MANQVMTIHGPVRVSPAEAQIYQVWRTALFILERFSSPSARERAHISRLRRKIDLFEADCERVARFKEKRNG